MSSKLRRLEAKISVGSQVVLDHEALVSENGDIVQITKTFGVPKFPPRIVLYMRDYCKHWLPQKFVIPSQGSEFSAVLKGEFQGILKGISTFIDDRGIIAAHSMIDLCGRGARKRGTLSDSMPLEIELYVPMLGKIAYREFQSFCPQYEFYLSTDNFTSRLKLEPSSG